MKALFTMNGSLMRLILAALLVLGVTAAAFLPSAPVAASGHTGQALILRAVLHPALSQAEVKSLGIAQAKELSRDVKYVGHKAQSGFPRPRPMAGGAQTNTPPSLVPYSAGLTGEVVHVTDANGNIVRQYVAPNTPVTFTVRLSDQGTGIDDNNVYIQIKDPDSLYQDTNITNGPMEHKVFTQDEIDSGNLNNLNPSPSNNDSGSATQFLYNGGAGNAYAYFTVNNNLTRYEQRGAVGSYDSASAQSITVGRSRGGQNPVSVGTPPVQLPGDDPSQFTSFGQEYECQYLNAHDPRNGSPAGYLNGADASAADYGTPYYLAGVDDQQPGTAPAARSEWLQLLPANPDGNGHATPEPDGTYLYTATWTSPISPSDYYLDVIAYDKSSPADWRIYDNVWGFSTQQFPDAAHQHDILLVSDNCLGQKFVAGTFGQQGLTDLVPSFYGAESYYSDYDIDRLPTNVFPYVQPTANAQAYPESIPLTFTQGINNVLNGLGVGSYDETVLGPDAIIDRAGQTAVQNGLTVPISQQYDIWRILARGAVDPAVLARYSGQFVSQPAVNDTAANPPVTAPAATVPVSNRCVIWASPYTYDLPLNIGGSLADPATQTMLTDFVQGQPYKDASGNVTNFAGFGRLFVSGPSVGSAVTLRNSDPARNQPGSFIYNTLNAQWQNTILGGQAIAGGNGNQNRISHDAFFNFQNSYFGRVAMNFNTLLTNNGNGLAYQAPGGLSLTTGNDYIDQPGAPPPGQPQWRTDGCLGALGPYDTVVGTNGNSVLGSVDSVTAENGAHTDMTIGGATGLIYNENFNLNADGTLAPGYGSRVIYSSFGLDEIGTEYARQTFTINNVSVAFFADLNQRANILHNIVCYLRTGTFTGVVYAANSNGTGNGIGQPISKATVYLVAQNNVQFPGPRQIFSGVTDANGRYTIQGVEPGAYQVIAYRPGYTRAVSNPGTQGDAAPYTVEGDTSTNDINLNITALPPGRISGTVLGTLSDGTTVPVGGAQITFTSQDGLYTATGTSNPDGTYLIDGVVPDIYDGSASAPGYTSEASTPDPVTVPSGKLLTPVDFNLPVVPGTLGGRLIDDFNKLIVGATITVTEHNLGKVYTTTTNSGITPTPAAGQTGDGLQQNYTLTLPQLQAGDYYTATVSKLPANYSNATPVNVTTAPIVSMQFTRQDFQATSSLGGFGGLIYDAQTSKPITGATITITDANGNAVQTVTTVAETTPPSSQDGDGQPLNFVTDLPQGTYHYTVTAPHYFPVPASGTLTVTVVHTVGNPAASFTRIKDGSGIPNIGLTTTYGTLGGLVVDNYDGTPIQGATVTVKDANGNVVKTYTTFTPPTTTPNDGVTSDGKAVNFVSDQTTFDEGTYTVTVSAPNFTTSAPITVNLKHLTFNRVSNNNGKITLQSTLGTVGGLVIDSQTGKPLGSAIVSIAPIDSAGNVGSAVYTVTTAADGSTTTPGNGRYGDGKPVSYVTSPPLSAGTYQISVSKQGGGSVNAPDYETYSAKVTITPDTFLRKDITLIYAYGNVEGLVYDTYTKQPIPAASITILDGTGNAVANLTSRAATSAPLDPSDTSGPINYATTQPLYEGAYTIVVEATNHTTLTLKNVQINGSKYTREDAPLNSTIGTLGGLVADSYSGSPAAGVTVSVTNAANQVVANFTTSPTTTTPVAPVGDGKPLNYSGPLTQGTYTVSVSKRGYGTVAAQTVTITPNAFMRIDFSGATTGLPPIHVFPAGYNFFSAPYDYASAGVSFDQLFGTLNTGTRANPSAGSNRSHIFVWNPQIVQYILDPQAPADGVHLGQGYWVYLLKAQEVTTAGAAPTSNVVQVALQTGWNMIGVPSTTAIPVSGLTFLNPATGTRLTFDQASTTYHLISSPLYGYNGTSYDTLTDSGSLQPWQSYWIYAYSNVTVQIPTS